MYCKRKQCKNKEETVKTLLIPGRGSNPRPPGHQSFITRRSNRSAEKIRPRIFRIRHPWSSTLCQNSQGRCGNHCKKQEEPVKTRWSRAGVRTHNLPGPNLSAKRSRPVCRICW
ncbi:hypothetical protein Bbelb_164510 [Branchiostoma belcheri]|nr:hypothetical protein Bbelb_164510 [Branchiostoma belcheri]